jgi:hypothetical protein
MKILSALLISLAWAGALAQAPQSPVQYNGIVLPPQWPPANQSLAREPSSPPPYLITPPRPIRIDVGRQLFVDEFLVEQTNLKRTFHLPEYHPASPVLVPDKPWEGSHAAPFSDGVFYDPADRLFKMWYWAAGGVETQQRMATCLATSVDGIKWIKPVFDVVPGTNIVLVDDPDLGRNSSTVWLDLNDRNPERRYKMFRNVRQKSREWHVQASYSADGIHWTNGGLSSQIGDRTTFFYNGFRNVWVGSLRTGGPLGERVRAYYEHPDVERMLHWRSDGRKDVDWAGADNLDPSREDLELFHTPARPFDLTPSQLYNLDCVAYESVLLGLFSIWRGQQMKPLPKINELCVGYSRDGFHWSRPDRRAFCPVKANEPVWNSGNLQSSGGCCLVVGEKLYFYVGAVAKGSKFPDPTNVGLAVLRRDGFASMDAADEADTLTTREVTFSGKYLFVNAAVASGELRAEILDPSGSPIAPFTAASCAPITGDATKQLVTWDTTDLSSLAGKQVKFRFHLRRGELYSFWVAQDEGGASNGFVAAGGPGFSGPVDRPKSEPGN